MAVTVVTKPTYPKAGAVRCVFTCSTGTAFRLWCSDAPPGSTLRKHLDETVDNATAARVAVGGTTVGQQPADPLGSGVEITLQLDVGGVYTFKAQEITYGASTWGGGFTGDPRGYKTETVVGESTVSVYVGQRITCPLGTPEYGTATLVLWIWDSTIRATTLTEHGENSPAIIDPKSDKAKTAIANTTVIATLTTFVNATVATMLGNLAALHAEMKTDIAAHFTEDLGVGSIHTNPDTNNDDEIDRLPTSPTTPAGYLLAAQILRRRLYAHMTNDNGSGVVGGGQYHNQSSKGPDFENALAALPPSGANLLALVWMAYGDLYRAYEAHRIDTDFHSSADTANPLAATLPPLCALHRDFLNALRVMAPTAPSYQNAGVTLAVHSAGFAEVSL